MTGVRKEEAVKKIKETLEVLDVVITDTMAEQFLQYYDLFCEKNQVMNLSAITGFEDVLEKHFLDSLSLVIAMPELKNYSGAGDVKPHSSSLPAGGPKTKGCSLLDLGTGAGFPGIPLKIVFPELDIVLADSLNKRLLFLEEVIETCHLEQIRTVHGRAEDLGKRGSEMREHFDIVVSRAVANLSSLSEYCLPFVKKGGCFVSYKSGSAMEEIENARYAINILGGSIEKECSFTLPGTDLNRTLVVIRKNRETPGKFPRKAGTPVKQPLTLQIGK